MIGAVLAGMTMTLRGHEVPTLRAFQVALLIAAGAALAAAAIARSDSATGGFGGRAAQSPKRALTSAVR